MATVYRCDKCLRESADKKEIVCCTIPGTGSIVLGGVNAKSMDLCAPCIQRMHRFLEPDPKQAPAR